MAATQFSLRALLIATTLAAIGAAMIAQGGRYGGATACTFCACGAIVSLWRCTALSYWRLFFIGLCATVSLAAVVFVNQFYETSATLIAQLEVYDLLAGWSESSEAFVFTGSARGGAMFSAAFAILCIVSTAAVERGWRRVCAIALALIVAVKTAQSDFAALQRLGGLEFWRVFHFWIPTYDGALIVDMHGVIIAIQVLGAAFYVRELICRRPKQAMAIATMLVLFRDWAAVVWLRPMNDYL